MNKFDITRIRPQWLVALVALALVLGLPCAGCTSSSSDNTVAADDVTEVAVVEEEGSGGQSAPDKVADITVPVSIEMPGEDGIDPKTIEVTIVDGATVLDALEATGWEVVKENGDYGTFVTAINGVENGSEGSASGWVYTVNDEQVMEACDVCALTAGDSVEWSFITG